MNLGSNRGLLALGALVALLSVTACQGAGMQETPLPPTAPQSAATSESAPAPQSDASDTSGDDTSPTRDAGNDAPVLHSAASPSTSLARASQPVAGVASLRPVCRHPADTGRSECDAIVRTDVGGAAPNGYHGTQLRRAFARKSGCNGQAPYCASDIQMAYGAGSAATRRGGGLTVAVVEAYGYPGAASDLAVYRSNMALPACTARNGCLKIVNERGAFRPLPSVNADEDWRAEEALDLDMLSATCPKCSILLVEAGSNKRADLAAAVNAAVARGAIAVANGYSGGEESAADRAYDHPKHAIVASAGNAGVGAVQPCSYASVVCAGGTTLELPRQERAWNQTGSGCSADVPKPQWQRDGGCSMRSETDVAAVADPATGVAFYEAPAGWQEAGGTNVAASIVTALFALAPSAARVNAPRWLWQHGGSPLYHDVIEGSNGECAAYYLCHAGKGYDGPTGWGTPSRLAGS